MPYKDKEKKAENERRWRRENPEKVAEYYRRHRQKNKEKIAESNRRYRQANPEKELARNRRRKYGLSHEQYQDLLIRQGNRCGICRASFDETTACVDHDHDTGTVRGLLCGRCNLSLGMFGDSLAGIMAAADYLKGGSHDASPRGR